MAKSGKRTCADIRLRVQELVRSNLLIKMSYLIGQKTNNTRWHFFHYWCSLCVTSSLLQSAKNESRNFGVFFISFDRALKKVQKICKSIAI